MLFAYGTLIPREPALLQSEGWMPDAVRGQLYDFGPHPALVAVDDSDAGWVPGYVRPVAMEELEGPLDAYEEVSKGLFRRVQTATRAGRIAWVYVFSGQLPPYARGPIERWLPPAGVLPPGGVEKAT
jgi:gamma-glutamylcyclotransferase (GGCT)/AIG2-like uncharacterized protein YtfP